MNKRDDKGPDVDEAFAQASAAESAAHAGAQKALKTGTSQRPCDMVAASGQNTAAASKQGDSKAVYGEPRV